MWVNIFLFLFILVQLARAYVDWRTNRRLDSLEKWIYKNAQLDIDATKQIMNLIKNLDMRLKAFEALKNESSQPEACIHTQEGD